jgi:hypothetical protein
MTYFCTNCVTSWAPYQALGGVCPRCKTGTERRNEPISEGADEMFRTVKDLELQAQESEQRHRDFEVAYKEWDAAHSHEEWRATCPDLS